jgi:hypothetical protein
MVDALRSVLSVLRTGGVLIDVRPSTAQVPRLEHDGHVIGRLVPTDHTRHHSADRAIAQFVADGALRPTREGRFWFRHTFADRASLREWIAGRDDWAAPAVSLPPGPITLRRAVAFTHYLKR